MFIENNMDLTQFVFSSSALCVLRTYRTIGRHNNISHWWHLSYAGQRLETCRLRATSPPYNLRSSCNRAILHFQVTTTGRLMDRDAIAQKISLVHCLIDELNCKGVAITSVTVINEATIPEFHGNEPIAAVLKKYCDEIIAVKRRVKLKVARKPSVTPPDLDMLKEPLTEIGRGELRSHLFTLVKMWQNLNKGRFRLPYN